MRCHASPRTPGLSHFCEGLGIRPLAQTEGDARRLLDREIARRKSIGMAEAEQKIYVGGPGPNSMQCRQRRVCLVGVHVSNRGEINAAFGDRFSDLPDRLDLWGGQAKPLEPIGASTSYGVVMKGIESGKQPGANCGSACG